MARESRPHRNLSLMFLLDPLRRFQCSPAEAAWRGAISEAWSILWLSRLTSVSPGACQLTEWPIFEKKSDLVVMWDELYGSALGHRLLSRTIAVTGFSNFGIILRLKYQCSLHSVGEALLRSLVVPSQRPQYRIEDLKSHHLLFRAS